MLVYRVENSSKSGPYAGGAVVHNVPGAYGFHGAPCPYNDGIDDEDFAAGAYMADRGGRQCAFESIEHLLAWFGVPDLDRMAAADTHISVIDVPDDEVKIGRHQVTIPRNAKRVGYITSTSEVFDKACTDKLADLFHKLDSTREPDSCYGPYISEYETLQDRLLSEKCKM